jgi:hypothetical protein
MMAGEEGGAGARTTVGLVAPYSNLTDSPSGRRSAGIASGGDVGFEGAGDPTLDFSLGRLGASEAGAAVLTGLAICFSLPASEPFKTSPLWSKSSALYAGASSGSYENCAVYAPFERDLGVRKKNRSLKGKNVGTSQLNSTEPYALGASPDLCTRTDNMWKQQETTEENIPPDKLKMKAKETTFTEQCKSGVNARFRVTLGGIFQTQRHCRTDTWFPEVRR